MERLVVQFGLDILRLCGWLLIIMTIFVPLERIWSLHPQKVLRKDFFRDLLYYFINNILPKLLLIVPMAIAGWTAHRFVPAGIGRTFAGLPVAARLAVALLVAETGFYWGHRWSHQIPFLWRFHAVHHSAEEMDWLVNTRVHPLDMVFTRLCGFVPLYVLGLANPMGGGVDYVTLFLIFASVLWGFFVHANLKWRFGPLEWLVTAPAFHHWHHTFDAPLNRNFASMLPILDWVFGTFHMPKAEWPKRYGTDSERAGGSFGAVDRTALSQGGGFGRVRAGSFRLIVYSVVKDRAARTAKPQPEHNSGVVSLPEPVKHGRGSFRA